MTLTVMTPPDGEVLSLDAAKDYLRIGTGGEDALVTALIASARLEAASGLVLVTRTLKDVLSVRVAEIGADGRTGQWVSIGLGTP